MGGGDKALLHLAGRPLLTHVVSRFAPQVDKLALNANGDARRFSGFGLPVIADTLEGYAGPLAGILAGLEWAASDPSLDRLASVSADSPFFPAHLVERLAAAVEGSPDSIAVACSAGRRHPVFALWPVSLRTYLHRFLTAGERKVSLFLDAHACVEVDFPPEGKGSSLLDPFFNINTPQDLAEAGRWLGEHRG